MPRFLKKPSVESFNNPLSNDPILPKPAYSLVPPIGNESGSSLKVIWKSSRLI